MNIKNTILRYFSLEMTRLLLMLVAIISGLSSSVLAQSGTLDTTFAAPIGSLYVTTPNDPRGGYEADSVLQADGKIVSLMLVGGTTMRNSIVRLNANGSIDTSFGFNNSGFRDIVWSAPNGGFASTISIQLVQTPNGIEERFVIAGTFPTGPNSSITRIERYTNSGAPDSTFGVNGVASFNGSSSDCSSLVQPLDQKIIIACGDVLLARLNANGTPDSSFGINGISKANPGIFIRDLSFIPSNGRILAIGDFSQGKGRSIAVARFNINGSLDDGGRNDSTPGDSFGAGGKAIANVSTTQYAVAGMFDAATGNIYVVGEAQIGGSAVQNYDAIIVRLNYAGQFDTNFGAGGKTILNIANLQDEFTSITLFNGMIIVGGEGRGGGTNNADYLVARYNMNGTLDTTFGGNGWMLYNFFGSYDHASNVFIQADPGCNGCPKLVVIGGAFSNNADPQAPRYVGLLRLNL